RQIAAWHEEQVLRDLFARGRYSFIAGLTTVQLAVNRHHVVGDRYRLVDEPGASQLALERRHPLKLLRLDDPVAAPGIDDYPEHFRAGQHLVRVGGTLTESGVGRKITEEIRVDVDPGESDDANGGHDAAHDKNRHSMAHVEPAEPLEEPLKQP